MGWLKIVSEREVDQRAVCTKCTLYYLPVKCIDEAEETSRDFRSKLIFKHALESLNNVDFSPLFLTPNSLRSEDTDPNTQLRLFPLLSIVDFFLHRVLKTNYLSIVSSTLAEILSFVFCNC